MPKSILAGFALLAAIQVSESEMRFIAADCGDVKPITPPER